MNEPALPGAPAFEAMRVRIFGQAKADPVLFVRTPVYEPDDDSAVKKYRYTFDHVPYPWDAVRKLAPRFLNHPKQGRASLLHEGYVYAETPDLAFALVDNIRTHYLFTEPRIWIQRGARTFYATRNRSGTYVFESGPEQGKPVRLLLLDRIGTGEPPPPLHRDLRWLRYQLHFDSARIVRITEKHVIADLRYGTDWIPSVLVADGARLSLECESIPSEAARRITDLRAERERRERALQPLRGAMLAQIEESLPFDEPLTEWGQQDGFLRFAWFKAYISGQRGYRFNGDRYTVYDLQGRPQPPQVCIDFLYDTLERASGTWWRPLGEKPERVIGGVDFGTLADTALRRADKFVDFARSQPARFEVLDVPYEDRVPMWNKPEFFRKLQDNPERFQPGDMVLIRGYTSFEKRWERHIMHFHSFFIYETDPVSGVPIAIVGNPGRPAIRTWLFEGLRTPKRSIWYRIRPKLDWLESAMKPDPRLSQALEPPTLSAGPS